MVGNVLVQDITPQIQDGPTAVCRTIWLCALVSDGGLQ